MNCFSTLRWDSMCCNRTVMLFFFSRTNLFFHNYTPPHPFFYPCLSRTNGVEINLIDLISTYAHMKNLESKNIDAWQSWLTNQYLRSISGMLHQASSTKNYPTPLHLLQSWQAPSHSTRDLLKFNDALRCWPFGEIDCVEDLRVGYCIPQFFCSTEE